MLTRLVLLPRTLQRTLFFATNGFQRDRSQSVSPLLDVRLNLSWRIDHLGRVEDRMTADESGELGVGSEFIG